MLTSIPAVHYAASVSPLLPILVAAARGGWRGPGGWVVLVCVISVLSDGLGLLLSARGTNNQWLAYLVGPLFFAAILLALAVRQETTLERTALRIAAALLLVALGGLAFVADDLENFSQFAIPLGSLLVLGAAAWTLVRGGLTTGDSPARPAHWFWVPAGFALYGAVTAAYLPLVAAFSRSDVVLVDAVLKLKSALVVVAFGLVGWGIFCQTPEPYSGRSSSPSSSPSGSS